MVLVTVVPLQVLRILLVFEDTTPYLLPDISVTEIRQSRMEVLWDCIIQGPVYVGSDRFSSPHTVRGGIWHQQGNHGGIDPHTVGGWLWPH